MKVLIIICLVLAWPVDCLDKNCPKVLEEKLQKLTGSDDPNENLKLSRQLFEELVNDKTALHVVVHPLRLLMNFDRQVLNCDKVALSAKQALYSFTKFKVLERGQLGCRYHAMARELIINHAKHCKSNYINQYQLIKPKILDVLSGNVTNFIESTAAMRLEQREFDFYFFGSWYSNQKLEEKETKLAYEIIKDLIDLKKPLYDSKLRREIEEALEITLRDPCSDFYDQFQASFFRVSHSDFADLARFGLLDRGQRLQSSIDGNQLKLFNGPRSEEQDYYVGDLYSDRCLEITSGRYLQMIDDLLDYIRLIHK